MRVHGKHHRTIALTEAGTAVEIIDQTRLPGAFETVTLSSLDQVSHAIRTMQVRGAPLIGVTAAFGLAIAITRDASDTGVESTASTLLATRPTAVNLRWALDDMRRHVAPVPLAKRGAAAFARASALAEADVATCRALGENGAALLFDLWRDLGRPDPFHVLTHCNAGWLATVDWGTALAPIYLLHAQGVPIHVWVSETRPRNQGLLTEWELAHEGVKHTLIVDNAAGHLLAMGCVHAVIVGADRTAANGDVCNKIGTYLKALAARDAGVPFFAAVPTSTIDLETREGKDIPIEERSASELGAPLGVAVLNPAFDVTPARLVTAIITENGVVAPSDVATVVRSP